MQTLPRPFRGILPPVATPLVGQDAVDFPSLEKLVERMIGAGVNGLFALGTTAEAASLSMRTRAELIAEICALAAGKVPVIVNITDPSRTESLRLAEHAARAGAAGLAISPPYYFTLTQEELLGYLERLAPKLPRPVYLYNFPALTKIGYSVETVKRASQMENVW